MHVRAWAFEIKRQLVRQIWQFCMSHNDVASDNIVRDEARIIINTTVPKRQAEKSKIMRQ